MVLGLGVVDFQHSAAQGSGSMASSSDDLRRSKAAEAARAGKLGKLKELKDSARRKAAAKAGQAASASDPKHGRKDAAVRKTDSGLMIGS